MKYRPDTSERFKEVSHAPVTEPGNALSLEEQENLFHLARKKGIEYGEMDVLRCQ